MHTRLIGTSTLLLALATAAAFVPACAAPSAEEVSPSTTSELPEAESAGPRDIVILPFFLPNLKTTGSFVQYKNAGGFWRVDFQVTNTGSAPMKVGCVQLGTLKDDGTVAPGSYDLESKWASTTVNPGEVVTLHEARVIGFTNWNLTTPIATLPSVAPYSLRIDLDVGCPDLATPIGQTTESNETDNRSVLDLK
jgi:hypothetical protein